ncbi:MAG TPA: arginine deiminase-related protein [Candidatus Tumulicola sp.]|nr:arginine deiminase-related protein [Candidatus Tumulicola sp.]
MADRLRFLMCRPDFFDVSYVINPWMEGNVNRAARAIAAAQWQRLFGIVSSVARVELVEPRPGLPDMPFTANASLVLGNSVVLSRFKYDERQGEERHFERWFASRGFKVIKLPESIPFEGAGDALIDRGQHRVWAGFGHRSSRQSLDLVESILDVEVLALRLVDPRFYHLDTCFCPIEGGSIMYFPQAFDRASNRLIEDRVPAPLRIPIGEKDALAFACNAINVGNLLVMNKASADLRRRLRACGLRALESDLSEFMKAGGSAKCLTLRLDEPRPAAEESAFGVA